MLKKPLVSAIMPTYNMGKYIGDAIEGIVNQTYPNWELIIVDDGSNDKTEVVVNKFKDNRITYIKQENRGRGAARNTALRYAKGVYIAITDADDISLPYRFEQQVSFLDSNPHIAVVGGQVLHFTDKTQPVRLASYPLSPSDVRRWYQKGMMGVPHPTAMIRAKVFEEVGSYCEECLRAQDMELFLRISYLYNMSNLEEEVLLYRGDPRETSFSFWLYLYLYYEYALYRYKCFTSKKEPLPFEHWQKKSLLIWCKLLTWHTLRYVKNKIMTYIKLPINR